MYNWTTVTQINWWAPGYRYLLGKLLLTFKNVDSQIIIPNPAAEKDVSPQNKCLKLIAQADLNKKDDYVM